ncbi:hypothetical protein SNK03_012411 [Fusarium graminearum]
MADDIPLLFHGIASTTTAQELYEKQYEQAQPVSEEPGAGTPLERPSFRPINKRLCQVNEYEFGNPQRHRRARAKLRMIKHGLLKHFETPKLDAVDHQFEPQERPQLRKPMFAKV